MDRLLYHLENDSITEAFQYDDRAEEYRSLARNAIRKYHERQRRLECAAVAAVVLAVTGLTLLALVTFL